MSARITLAAAAALALLALSARAQEAEPAPAPADSQEAPPPESPPAAKSEAKKPKAKEDVNTVEVPLDEKKSGDVTELETITVTSEKRVKMQRDIPGSVGAMRGADLEAMRAQSMRDYLKLIPGVTYLDQGNEESVPIIRGIATEIGFGNTSVPAGVYMDDMPFGDLFGPSSVPDLNPFDLERVEVLKGPQGTLFGSGALAGAIRYIVQKPNFGVWEAKVSETVSRTVGSHGLAPVTGVAVNIPLFGDHLAFRIVGLERRDPGVYDMAARNCTLPPVIVNTVLGSLPITVPLPPPGQLPQLPGPLPSDPSQNCNGLSRDDTDADKQAQRSGRVLGSWQATDRFKVAAMYFEQHTHQDDFGLTQSETDTKTDMVPFASPRKHDFGGGNLSLTYDFDWASILSSTNRMTKDNFLDSHNDFFFGFGEQNQFEYFSDAGDTVRGWTQEIRVSSPEGSHNDGFEWLAGGSYLHYGNKSFQYAYVGPNRPDPHSTQGLSDVDIAESQVFSTTDQLAEEKAVFGEITSRFGEHWEGTLGLRKYETDLTADTNLCGAQIIAFFQSLCHPQHFTDEASGLNPKVALRYIHNKHAQVYLLAAKGFQFGGVQVNPPAPGFPETAQMAGYSFGPYKSSSLWNYEMGLRTEWLDRRLRFDMAAFYMDWKDLQLTVFVDFPVNGSNVPFNVIANVGRAHSEGIETALEVAPFAGAKWTSSASWITAVTDEVFDAGNADGPVTPGTRLPGTPKFQWSNVVSYEHQIPYLGHWTAGPVLTHAHVGTSPDAVRPTGEIGGYDTIDLRLAFADPSSRYTPELTFGVRNLMDVRGKTFHIAGSTPLGETYSFQHFIPPRTTMLSLSFKY